VQKQRIILIVAGVILGLIAMVMLNAYVNQQRTAVALQAKKTIEQIKANQVAVLVAKKDIPVGVAIASDMLDTQIIPTQYRQPQTVSSLDRIDGMITVAPISQGEQINLGKLTNSRKTSSGLAGMTPMGKRAITVPVDNIASVGGMIRPGDYVDVIAMMPVPAITAEGKETAQVAVLPLFQNVLILAVGSNIGAPEPQEGRYKKEAGSAAGTVTFALAPQEASLVAFVQEQGKIRLVLRSPADSKIEPIQPARWETLFQYISQYMPQAPRAEVNKPVEVAPEEYVDVYRGLRKEKIPLSK